MPDSEEESSSSDSPRTAHPRQKQRTDATATTRRRQQHQQRQHEFDDDAIDAIESSDESDAANAVHAADTTGTAGTTGTTDTTTVRFEALRLDHFKGFGADGLVEIVDPALRARFGPESGAGLACVIGPNGSGKSTLADAVLFCLGTSGSAIRAKRLDSLVSDHSKRRYGEDAVTMSVGLDLRVVTTTAATDGSSARPTCAGAGVGAGIVRRGDKLLRITRTLVPIPGHPARTTFTIEETTTTTSAAATPINAVAAPSSSTTIATTATANADATAAAAAATIIGGTTTVKKRRKKVSQKELAVELKAIGINLDVVDSFVTKQQAGGLANMPPLELLAFIERLVGTDQLVAQIKAQSTIVEVESQEVGVGANMGDGSWCDHVFESSNQVQIGLVPFGAAGLVCRCSELERVSRPTSPTPSRTGARPGPRLG